MDWSALSAGAVFATLVYLIFKQVIIPRCQSPRITISYPGGTTEFSVTPNQEKTISFHALHTGGWWKIPGRSTRELWIYCYFPPPFDIIESIYKNDLNKSVNQNPAFGKWSSYKYIIVGNFWLAAGCADDFSLKIKTPNVTGSYQLHFQIAEGRELKYLDERDLILRVA